MDTSLPSQSFAFPVCFLVCTALSQLVLSLWVMDWVDVTKASSIILGFVLFGLLAKAVRDVFVSVEEERRAFCGTRRSR